jgi:hypothetical protein
LLACIKEHTLATLKLFEQTTWQQQNH